MRLGLNILICCMLLIGCKKDNPSPPGQVALISPTKNSECSPVDSSTGNTNSVQFEWQASSNTDSYKVQIENLNTGVTQTMTTASLSVVVPVTKGTPFSWAVISENTKVTETTMSEKWFFFSPGSESSHTPFPAEVLSPNGPKAFIDDNGEVTLNWQGSDIDGDIEGYDIYYSTTNPPNLFESKAANETSTKAAAITNTDYFWKIITKDSKGNTSDTGVLAFKAI